MYEGKKVLDVTNSPLQKLPYKQWNAPCNLDKFLAPVAAVHNVYSDLKGKYMESCTNCEKENPKENNNKTQSTWKSCRKHASHPLLSPRGNVVTSNMKERAMSNYCLRTY